MAVLKRFGWGQLRGFLTGSEKALYGDLPPGTDINAAADVIGRQKLAEQISGTTDHRSRKYKNARDYISRHVRGSRRTVKPEFSGRVSKALREDRRAELSSRGSMQVDIVADVRVSKRTWKNGKMKAQLTGEQLDEYLDALDRGDGNAAMAVFLDAYDTGGRFPESVAEIPAIHDVRYT
jgi:hypothetical protein